MDNNNNYYLSNDEAFTFSKLKCAFFFSKNKKAKKNN